MTTGRIPYEKLVDYVQNRLSQEELITIGQQIHSDPDLEKTVQGIRLYLRDHPESELIELNNRIENRIDQTIEKHQNKGKSNRTKYIIISIVVIITLSIIIYFLNQ